MKHIQIKHQKLCLIKKNPTQRLNDAEAPASCSPCIRAKSEGSVNAVVNCNLYAVFKQRVEFDEEIKRVSSFKNDTTMNAGFSHKLSFQSIGVKTRPQLGRRRPHIPEEEREPVSRPDAPPSPLIRPTSAINLTPLFPS